MPGKASRLQRVSARALIAATQLDPPAAGSGVSRPVEMLPALIAQRLPVQRCALWLLNDARTHLQLVGPPYGFTPTEVEMLAGDAALAAHGCLGRALTSGVLSAAQRRAVCAALRVPYGEIAVVLSGSGPAGLCYIAPQGAWAPGAARRALLSLVAGRIALALAQERAARAADRAARLALVQRTAHALAAATSMRALCEVLADTIYQLMGYNLVNVFLRDGEGVRLIAYRLAHGTIPDDVSYVPPGAGIVGHVWVTGAPYLCRDTSTDPYFRSPGIMLGNRSEVAVPLCIGAAIEGVLNLESLELNAFGEEDVATLTAIADQAAIAMQNVRLYEQETELRRRAEIRARRLEHVQRVGERLKMELDEQEIGMRVVEAAREALGFRMAVLNLFDRPGDPTSRARVVAMAGIPPEGEAALLDHDFSLADVQVLFRPEFRRSHSYFIPEEARSLTAESGVTTWTPAIANIGPDAWLAGDELLVPLTDRAGGHLYGFLSVDDPENGRRPELEDVEVLEIFADQAVVALRNAYLLAHARRQAERDPITGLLNHRAANARLDAALPAALARGEPLSLIAIDIDNFKLINDTHGHLTGDAALRHVARLLQQSVRTSDIVARLGGDEFLVILPGAAWEQAMTTVERLSMLLQEMPLPIEGTGAVPLSLSAGVATCPDDAVQPQALFASADARLYETKRSGRQSTRNAREARQDDLELDGFDMLSALVTTVDNKDRYTSEHSEQVATYACALADALGLSREIQRTLRVAGLLHDVGKIGVPDRILRKPGPLTADEWETMKQHATLSTTLLRTVGIDADVLTAVAHHHERWDGAGYPLGLRETEVPLLGRIMILADAVSAMALDRPYRAGLPAEQVVAELRAQAGRQFDPALVEPFIARFVALQDGTCEHVA